MFIITLSCFNYLFNIGLLYLACAYDCHNCVMRRKPNTVIILYPELEADFYIMYVVNISIVDNMLKHTDCDSFGQ